MDPGYVLKTGDAGAGRLALLERVYGGDCHRLLQAAGVGPGLRVADIGCGTGSTSAWLAAQVGIAGHVAAVDVDPGQLAVAGRRLADAGLRNVELVAASALATGLPRASFDVVHCRFLLCHIPEPLAVLREMAALAKPGGLVIVFDMDVPGLRTYPETEGYRRLREAILLGGRARGCDFEIGPKLPILFRHVGLDRAEAAVIQPVHLRGEEKRLWEYTAFEAKEMMLRYGVMSASEFDSLAGPLEAVAKSETCAVIQVPLFACWARKDG